MYKSKYHAHTHGSAWLRAADRQVSLTHVPDITAVLELPQLRSCISLQISMHVYILVTPNRNYIFIKWKIKHKEVIYFYDHRTEPDFKTFILSHQSKFTGLNFSLASLMIVEKI